MPSIGKNSGIISVIRKLYEVDVMKLLLLLIILVCRELVVEELRVMLTRPLRQWRDSLLQFREGRAASVSAMLALIVLTPALLAALLLLLASMATWGMWSYLIILTILVPVFIDRRLPSVLLTYRQQWLDATVVETPDIQLKNARLHMVSSCLQEVFTPLFWFLLLGTWGVIVVLIYYGLRLCAESSVASDIADLAKRWMAILDWLPSRLLGLSFALVGQFVETWHYWRTNIQSVELSAVEFLDAAAEQAEPLAQGQVLSPNLPMALVQMLAAYESLCYRSMMIWVVLFALHVVF